ncbi:MAG TPA: carboxypeptidase regulatory-like domain-containing protein, partial [Polyangia bacterium]|nr:carboxypeptidase regulatory-like domain-containing protein [Polyangia bacterium]
SDTAAPPDASSTPPIGIIGGRITMSSSAGVRGAGVAGVRITLNGSPARSAISDANGAYAFPDLPPGMYALALAKDGATFTPANATVVIGNSADADAGAPTGVVASFTCAAPCGSGPAIDPARELYIIDSSVIADARSSNTTGGPWSFRSQLEQAATFAPNRFAEIWIANLEASGRNMAGLRAQWPTTVENTSTLPDLSRAPFGLLAIVNGVDAHSSGQGEARLVYGIYGTGSNGVPELKGMSLRFTVMFRYALPVTAEIPTRQAWAARFHELAATPFGPDYNAKLQALTDVFTRAGVRPSTAENPRGSALLAVDINEAFSTNTPAQLRESQVLPDPVRGVLDLMVTTVEQTPDSSQNAHDGPLTDFLNANAVLVQTGLATLPAPLLGTQSSAFDPPVPWSFPSVTSEPLRHAFAGQTCVGCHSSEGPATFAVYHIIPFGGPTTSSLSGYLPIVEIPRRVSFMQNQLTCAGATCAPGAEPMMGPAR